jgi:2-deoxy-D-gluconate 3-dehydrogenase
MLACEIKNLKPVLSIIAHRNPLQSNYCDLRGRVALVTGASRGIGLSAATALAEAGADVIVCSRDQTQLEKVALGIQALGRKALPLALNVADRIEVQSRVREALSTFGRIDILVNSAGTVKRKPATEWTIEEWDEVIDVNLKGTLLLCQEVGKHLIARNEGGKIINIASLTSVIGIPNIIAYGSSKGGVVSLTKGLAVEWAKYRINVNAVGPGYIRTELTRALQEDKARSDYILSRIPFRRWGEPDDLKGTFVFLASPASDYITGQVIWVDGGWTAA